MNIYVTRHGQTDWNVLTKIQGQTDIELNDVGREQAKIAGESIKNDNIDLIITSPLKRAKETAQIINQHFNVPILENQGLIERNFGIHEGLTKAEIRILEKEQPEILDNWDYNKNVTINDVEGMKDFCDRIYSSLDEIIEKYNDKNVLIVTHGCASIPIKCYFTKYPLTNLISTKSVAGLKNCEVEIFKI